MAGGINPLTRNQNPNPRNYELEIARGFGSTGSGFSAVHFGSAQSPIPAVRFGSGSVHRFRFGSATSLESAQPIVLKEKSYLRSVLKSFGFASEPGQFFKGRSVR